MEKKWSVQVNDKVVVRGKISLYHLEQEVHFNEAELELEACAQMHRAIGKAESEDRYGSLTKLKFSRVQKFGAEPCGRVKRS